MTNRLNERDLQVLLHVFAFMVSWHPSLRRLFFPDAKLNAVTKVTSRLCRLGYLTRHTLYASQNYFTLGPSALSLFGASRRRVEPKGPQGLIYAFGTLCYLTLCDPIRVRFSQKQLSERLDLPPRHRLLNHPFYEHVDQQGLNRLAVVHVDCGGSPSYYAAKLSADLYRRTDEPVFSRSD